MKKANMAAVFAITAGLMLSGCAPKSSSFPPGQTVIYVSRDGSLYTALTQTYDPSDTGYSAEELEAMAEAEVAEYNKEYAAKEGDEPVSIAGCMVKEGMAAIVYQYDTGEDLCRFTQMSQDMTNHPESIELTTNSEGLIGEDSESGWMDARKNSQTTLKTVRKRHGLPVVVISGAVTVQTEGEILYYSGKVSLKDEYTAQVTEGTAYIVFR